jgi:CheY-like chemotaxis protein
MLLRDPVIGDYHTSTILHALPMHEDTSSGSITQQSENSALSGQYQIIPTSSAEEAVRTAARQETEIDLLLTKVRLPRVDGWELTELLKLDYPVCASGLGGRILQRFEPRSDFDIGY